MKKSCIFACLLLGNVFAGAITPEEAGLTPADLAGMEQELMENLCSREDVQRISMISGYSPNGIDYNCRPSDFNQREKFIVKIGYVFYCHYRIKWNDKRVKNAQVIICPVDVEEP